MADYVKKVIPYRLRETDAIEAWLEELAGEGLILEGDGFLSGLIFQRGEPIRLRFRIDIAPSAKSEKNKKRREQLAQRGWEYVASSGGNVIIYKNEDLWQRELPENPEVDARKSEPNWFKNLVILVLGICAITLMQLKFTSTGDSPTLYWLTEGFLTLLNLLYTCMFLIVVFGVEQYSIYQLNKRKADESFYRRSYHTKTRAKRGSVVKLASLCLGLLVMVAPFFQLAHDQREFIPLENYQKVLPIPQLSEINEEEGAKLASARLSENINVQTQARNEVVDERYPLLTHQIMLYQVGPDVRKEWDNTYLLNYYDACYYELRTEGLAERIFQDFTSKYRYESILSSNGLQVSYYHAENDDDWPSQALLLHYETKVLTVAYRGDRDLSQCVNLFVRYLGVHEAQMGTELENQADSMGKSE